MVVYVLLSLLYLLSMVSKTFSGKCFGVFCTPDISRRCRTNCGSLYLYSSTGGLVAVVQGHMERSRLRNVWEVEQVGRGCFILYKGPHFTGESYEILARGRHRLGGERASMTSVRSVQYNIDCEFHSNIDSQPTEISHPPTTEIFALQLLIQSHSSTTEISHPISTEIFHPPSEEISHPPSTEISQPPSE